MHSSNLSSQSCRLRRPSKGTPSEILATELLCAPDLQRDLRKRVRSHNCAAEQAHLSSIRALQLRLTDISLSAQQALHLIAQEALTITGADGAAIAMAQGQGIVCCAGAGSLAPALGTPISTRSGLSKQCLRTADAVRCNDTHTDPRVDADACRAADTRSVLMVPLQRDEDVIGIFAALSRHVAAFDDQKARQLQALAELALQQVESRLPDDEPDVLFSPACVEALRPANGVGDKSDRTAVTQPVAEQSEPRATSPSAQRWASPGKVSQCLDRIRQDNALQILGRAKAYLTIESLYDGIDRSHAIELCQRLMLGRAAEMGLVL